MDSPVSKIQADKSWSEEWKELVDNTELLYYFIWRNFKVRYKQTLIGAGWAVLKPLILMVVFTIAFRRIADVDTGDNDIPYPIFAYSGLLFWNYFAQTVNQTATSLLTFQNVIKKIYFPRMIAPISVTLTGLIDFSLSLLIYVGLMTFYGIAPTLLGVALFLPMVLLAVVTTLGIGLFMAAMNIRYRDVGQALPFLVQTLLFLTPVIYPVSLVPEGYRWLLYFNPLTGVVDTMQATMLDIRDVEWSLLLISCLSGLASLAIGILYFKAKEREFADVI